MNKITSFRNKYNFLSNFYLIDIEYNGLIFKSVEHAYQALKADNYNDMIYVKDSETPSIAKKRGRIIKIRPDWNNVKISIMKDLLNKKFQDEYLKNKLLKTSNFKLIEGNDWGDTFWGVDNNTGKGKNNLGILLTKIRNNLNKKQNKLGKMLLGNKN